MAEVLKLADQVAPSDASVLIVGESGSGKELVARYVHQKSNRANQKFISVNCAAIPENLLESELFGHEKGAFTGAVARRIGKFEEANGGTLLLDEISEMDPHLQAKLLRVIQEREIDRVGGTQPIKVDLRIIAATNRDLAEGVKQKAFREDLYYRLKVISIELPPLRNRKDDVPMLVQHFINKYNEQHDKEDKIQGIESNALKCLENYKWPGNIRELENTIERAVVLETGNMIRVASLPEEIFQAPSPADNLIPAIEGEGPVDLEQTLDNIEKSMLLGALGKTDGMINKAAKLLNLSFRSMRYRVKKHNISAKSEGNE
jgi:transcriptional regulator with PAS, ATPase and Fis domain